MFQSTIPEIIAIDQKRLTLYLQFLKQDASIFKRLGISLGIDLGPVSLKTIEPERIDQTNEIRKIKELCKRLVSSKALHTERASAYDDIYVNNKHFFLEKNILARKFLIKPNIEEVDSLEYLTLWVAEPNKLEPYVDYREKGTFLFLIESFWEDDNYHAMISGCSAFQWVVKNALKHPPESWTKFDRLDPRDPITRLKDIGAIEQCEKEISVLYRRRYMSNEQMFKLRDMQFRTFDVVGYPVVIYTEKLA